MYKYLFIFFILLFSTNAFGQSTYVDKVPMEYQGKVGAFIEENTLTSIIQDLTEFQSLKYKIVPDLKLEIKEYQLRISLLEKELEVTEQISEKYEESFIQSEKLRQEETQYLREKLDQKTAWYRSPGFMFSVGIVVGGLIAVGMAYGIDQSSR